MTPPMQIYRRADELLGRERLAHDQGHANGLNSPESEDEGAGPRRGAGPSRARQAARPRAAGLL